jgi:hypothetical protein
MRRLVNRGGASHHDVRNATLVSLDADGHAGAGVEHLAGDASPGNRMAESVAGIALDASVPNADRRHEADRYARDELVARVIGQVLAPGEKLADRHAGLAACRHRAHGQSSASTIPYVASCSKAP